MRYVKEDLLKFMQDVKNFKELERRLFQVTPEKYKGDLFELFVQAYLEIIYPTRYNQKFKSVNLFDKIKPEILRKLNLKSRQDYGIDLVALTEGDEIWTIQVKFRGADTVKWRELSTFRSSSEKADFMLVIGNINEVLHPHEELSRFSSILRYNFLELTEEDFDAIRKHLAGQQIQKVIHKPREHQARAIDNAIKYFKNNDKGKMIHACGTGKTLTALWIKEKLNAKNTIVYVPSLALLKQTLEEWAKHKNQDFSIKCVCSDKSVVGDRDEIDIDVTELGVPVTTDGEEVEKYLKNKDKHRIIFSTYQSAPVVLNIMKSLKGFKFDLGIFDEAHRTASKSNKLFTRCLDTPTKKKLFMTATPKLYALRLKKLAEEENILLCSMDDESIYGKEFDNIKFREAIDRKLLSDYKIKIIVVRDDKTKELIDRRFWTSVLEREVTIDEVAKAVALTKTMRVANHVVSFHSSVKGAKDFQKILKNLQKLLSRKGRKVLDIKSYHVSGSFKSSKRKEILDEFISQKKSLVTNARCLTEGVDVPLIDGIFFVDPKRNLIDIVQATGRAIRKKEGKEYGYIVIPIFIKGNEDIDEIIHSSAFDQVWKVIQAMKEQDEELNHIIEKLSFLKGKKRPGSLKARDNSEKARLRRDLANRFDLEDSILPKDINIKDFVDRISVRTLDVVGQSWDDWFGQYVAFKEEHKREPFSHSKKKEERSLAGWVGTNRKKYKQNRLPIYRAKKLKEINFDLNPFENIWNRYYKDYISFKEKHKEEPSTHSKNKEESRLGQWSIDQRIYFRKNKLSKDKIFKLNKAGFVWNPVEDVWERSYNDYVAFKKKYCRDPSYKSSNKLEKRLGIWCSNQKGLRRKGKLSNDKLNKFNKIGFTWNALESKWNNIYNNYVTFKKKYKQEPKYTKKNKKSHNLAIWIKRQKRFYHEGKLSKDNVNKLKKIGMIK